MMAVADYWWWLSAGMVLMVLEIVTPGIFSCGSASALLLPARSLPYFRRRHRRFWGEFFAILSVYFRFHRAQIMGKRQNETDTKLNTRGPVYRANLSGI